MAGDTPEFSFSHLFIAFPELIWEDKLVKYLRSQGYITRDGLEWIETMRLNRERLRYFQRLMRNKTVFERIMALTPEILNRKTILILEKFGFIDLKEASKLRIYLGILERAGKGGKPKDILAAILRVRRTFGFEFADNLLSYLVAMGQLSRSEANIVRAEMVAFRLVAGTVQDIVRAKSVLEAMQVIGSSLVGKQTIEFLKLSGIIDARIEASLLAALNYGSATWKVFEGALKAKGLAARMAYMLSGSWSWELVEFLKTLRFLTPQQAALLEVATIISQDFNRKMMEELTNRRFRVITGESPIVTFLRASKATEAQILQLLAEAADRARKEAEALADLKRVGAAARSAEYRLRVSALHQAMREIWEGNGLLTIFGERAAADAAVSSAEMLQTKYYKNLPDYTTEMLRWQARSGLDSFLSRQENTLQLSNRVYGNLNLWNKKVEKEINIGLLTGKSSSEIAKSVKHLIKPTVHGGVEYASLRLGRTELANAFHLTTIRHTREQPWVKGYKWNRSGSHRSNDTCDDYATKDHDNMGPGVFKKANVPNKPHPQCMCYLTVVGMTEDEFVKAHNKGRFDRYYETMFQEPRDPMSFEAKMVDYFGKAIGRAAGQVVVTQSLSAASRMLSTQAKNRGINPKKMVEQAAAAKAAGKSNPFKDGTFFNQILGVAEDAAPDAGEIDEAAEKRIKAALAKFEKEASSHTAAFAKRQSTFRALEAQEKTFNAFNPKGRRGWNKLEVDAFDYLSYEDILPPGGDTSSNPTFVKSMYGSVAYKSINSNLRRTMGNLRKYDAHWKHDKGLFKRLRDQSGDIVDDWDFFSEVAEGMGVDIDDPEDFSPDYTPKDDGLYLGRLVEIYSRFDMSKLSKHSDVVRGMDRAMHRTNGDRFVYRISGPEWTGLSSLSKDSIGQVFRDDGFTSTEGVKNYYRGVAEAEAMGGLDVQKRSIRAKIFLPDGTWATRVNDTENELAISRGSTYQILDVLQDEDTKRGGFTHTLHLMLINQAEIGELGLDSKHIDPEDFWGDLLMDF